MAAQQKGCAFYMFIITSFLTYITELGFACYGCYFLSTVKLWVWLALSIGLLAVPTLTAQLISFQWSGDHESMPKAACKALVHLGQVALPGRYIKLCCKNKYMQKELHEICVLRLFLACCSSLPLLLINAYILYTRLVVLSEHLLDNWILLGSVIATLISASWALTTYSSHSYPCFNSLPRWPGVFFKLIWRFGELCTRILVIVLFAQLHTFWIFLVIGLHWITEILLLGTFVKLQSVKKSKCKSATSILVTSYIFVFCHLNLTEAKTKFTLPLFYVIQSLENAALLILWLIYDKSLYLHLPVGMAIGVTYIFSIGSAILYYNCFNSKHAKANQGQRVDSTSTESTSSSNASETPPCPGCQKNKSALQLSAHRGHFEPAWIHVKGSNSPNVCDYFNHGEMGGLGQHQRGSAKDSGYAESENIMNLEGKHDKRTKQVWERYKYMKKSSTEDTDKSRRRTMNPACDDFIWDDYDLQLKETEIDDLYTGQKCDSGPDVDSGFSTMPHNPSNRDIWSSETESCPYSAHGDSSFSAHFHSEDISSSYDSETTMESYPYRRQMATRLGKNPRCRKCGKLYGNHIHSHGHGHRRRVCGSNFRRFHHFNSSLSSDVSSGRTRSLIKMGVAVQNKKYDRNPKLGTAKDKKLQQLTQYSKTRAISPTQYQIATHQRKKCASPQQKNYRTFRNVDSTAESSNTETDYSVHSGSNYRLIPGKSKNPRSIRTGVDNRAFTMLACEEIPKLETRTIADIIQPKSTKQLTFTPEEAAISEERNTETDAESLISKDSHNIETANATDNTVNESRNQASSDEVVDKGTGQLSRDLNDITRGGSDWIELEMAVDDPGEIICI